MKNTRVVYVGESEYRKEDRFAVVITTIDNQERVEKILDDIGYPYDAFGDSEDLVYYVQVDDKNDYKTFMSYWKEAKKTR